MGPWRKFKILKSKNGVDAEPCGGKPRGAQCAEFSTGRVHSDPFARLIPSSSQPFFSFWKAFSALFSTSLLLSSFLLFPPTCRDKFERFRKRARHARKNLFSVFYGVLVRKPLSVILQVEHSITGGDDIWGTCARLRNSDPGYLDPAYSPHTQESHGWLIRPAHAFGSTKYALIAYEPSKPH